MQSLYVKTLKKDEEYPSVGLAISKNICMLSIQSNKELKSSVYLLPLHFLNNPLTMSHQEIKFLFTQTEGYLQNRLPRCLYILHITVELLHYCSHFPADQVLVLR